MFKVRVPATSANLGAGFDCLALAVEKWLTLKVTVIAGQNWTIHTKGQGANTLPTGEDNLILKIVKEISQSWDSPLPGLKVEAYNDIPLKSGCGSSAAATVAAIMIASTLAKKALNPDTIVNLASRWEGHADNIAAAVYGGVCLTGMVKGGQVKTVPLPLLSDLPQVLLAVPGLQVSTVASRQALASQVPLSNATFNAARVGLAVYCWIQGDYQGLEMAMQDALHQHHRFIHVPKALTLLSLAHQQENVYGAALSGSGPTMMAIGQGAALKALSEKWQSTWAEVNTPCSMHIIEISRTGAHVT